MGLLKSHICSGDIELLNLKTSLNTSSVVDIRISSQSIFLNVLSYS